jgi:hypothetical protein
MRPVVTPIYRGLVFGHGRHVFSLKGRLLFIGGKSLKIIIGIILTNEMIAHH